MDRVLGRFIEFSMRRSGRVLWVFVGLSLVGAWAAWPPGRSTQPRSSAAQRLLTTLILLTL